jgi:porin
MSTWGAYARFAPTENFYARTGIHQVTPLSEMNRGQGFNLGFNGSTGVDFPLEFGFLSHDSKGNFTGSARLGGYYDTSNALGAESSLGAFVAPDNPALGQIPTTLYRGQKGAWIYLDHLVSGSSAPNERGVIAWGTYSYGDPQTAQFVNMAQAGFIVHGTFPHRNNDTIAFSWSYLDVNERLRTFEYQLQRQGYAVPINGVEQGLELNYGIDVGEWGFFRPAIQYIINPAGTTGGYVYPNGVVGIHNALVLGFNATILW